MEVAVTKKGDAEGLISQINSLDRVLDQQIKELADSRMKATWKRRARDRSFSLISQTSGVSMVDGNKRPGDPSLLTELNGHASKKSKGVASSKGVNNGKLVVAARLHHQ